MTKVIVVLKNGKELTKSFDVYSEAYAYSNKAWANTSEYQIDEIKRIKVIMVD